MPRRDVLPDNPSLKDINWFKKENNWGELPAFYHLVASSVGELEGMQTHGFDNAIKRITDKRNWNAAKLDGYETPMGDIVVNKKPRVALYQAFTERGFEIHAFPFANDTEIDQYVKEHPLMEFKVWDPSSMRLLLRVAQLRTFIVHCFEHKDPADKALVFYAHKLVEKSLEYLKSHVDVVKVEGESIKEFYEDIEAQIETAQQIAAMGELRPNVLNLTDPSLAPKKQD